MQIAQLAETGDQRAMQDGILGMCELLFELDQMTNYERAN
jgi:hypothetical protein